MYDRILQLLTERSAATRAKIAAMGGTAAFKQAAGDQKVDPLAQRAAVAAKKAKVSRVQSQGQSQPTVSVAASRKDARAAGQELIGTTGRRGSKLPRVAPTAAKPETDQRALVPVQTKAVATSQNAPLVRAGQQALATRRPEIIGRGSSKPIKWRDPGEQDAVLSPSKPTPTAATKVAKGFAGVQAFKYSSRLVRKLRGLTDIQTPKKVY